MREHFSKYNDILNRINELYVKIMLIKEKMHSIKGISFNNLPKSNGIVLDTSYYLSEIEEIESDIEELKKSKNALIKKYDEEISKLDDDRHKSIIRMLYIEKMTIYNVSCVLEISVSHARKLKRMAIDEFKLKNNIKW